jgi:hypothetical protein
MSAAGQSHYLPGHIKGVHFFFQYAAGDPADDAVYQAVMDEIASLVDGLMAPPQINWTAHHTVSVRFMLEPLVSLESLEQIDRDLLAVLNRHGLQAS